MTDSDLITSAELVAAWCRPDEFSDSDTVAWTADDIDQLRTLHARRARCGRDGAAEQAAAEDIAEFVLSRPVRHQAAPLPTETGDQRRARATYNNLLDRRAKAKTPAERREAAEQINRFWEAGMVGVMLGNTSLGGNRAMLTGDSPGACVPQGPSGGDRQRFAGLAEQRNQARLERQRAAQKLHQARTLL